MSFLFHNQALSLNMKERVFFGYRARLLNNNLKGEWVVMLKYR